MSTPAINGPTLDARLKAFKSLVDRGASIPAGRASEQYLREVDTALAQITQALATDQSVAGGTCSGGFIGLGQKCTTTTGAKTTKGAIDAAKELAPADAMIQATLRGIVERHTERQGRSLGRQAASWQRDLAAAQQRATAAAADLKAGKPGAAEALSTAIGQIRAAVRGAGAEATSDANAIAAMRRNVETFAPVARDTGIINRRREENAALTSARSVNDALRAEVDAERELSTRGPATVRPLATAQLESDPAFAARGYTQTLSTVGQWSNVIKSASETDQAASALAGAVSNLNSAHATAARVPQQLPGLDEAVSQASGASNAAGEALERATAEHARAASNLNARYNTAHAAFVLATANAVEANNAVGRAESEWSNWNDRVGSLRSEVSALETRLSSANSGTTPMPGAGGSTPMPGTGGGTPMPGAGTPMPGASSNAGKDTSEIRSELASRRSDLDNAVRNRNAAESRVDDAKRAYNGAAAIAATAAGLRQSILSDREANDNRLAGFDSAARNAAQAHSNARNAAASARTSLANARTTIANGERDVTAAANAYNARVPKLDSAIKSSTLPEDAKAALAAIPNPPLTVADAVAAVRGGANGVATLQRATEQLATKTGERVTLGERSKQALEQRATGLIDARVREALN